jgi:hypothetical protein
MEKPEVDKSREAYDAHVLRGILAERKRLREQGEQFADELAPMPYDDFITDYMHRCLTRQIAEVDSSGNVTWREGWPAFITRYVEVKTQNCGFLCVQLSDEPLK